MTIIPEKNMFHLGRLSLYFISLLLIYIPHLDYLMTESICYWYTHYGLMCPMCGGTRSFLNYMHLQFATAFSYNSALTLGLYPILSFLVLHDLYTIISNCFFGSQKVSLLLYFFNLLNRREA